MAIELDDGTIVRSLPEQVAYNDERIIDNTQEITDLKTKVEAALAGVFHYKGSVATYADLPASDNQVGDVWNVIDTGKNYAWSGSAWDDLGGAIDISNLVTLNTAQTITGIKTFSNGIKITSGQSIDAGTTQYKINNGNFSPSASADLGTSLYKWADLYLSGDIKLGTNWEIEEDSNYQLTIYRQNDLKYIFASLEFTPNYNDQNSLGNNDQRWKNLYLSGGINPNANGYKLALPDTSSLTADSELVDTASAQTITGVKTLSKIILDNATRFIEFKNGNTTCGFIDNSNNYLDLGYANHELKFYSDSIRSIGTIRPQNNNVDDLGTSSNKYKDLYLSGIVYTSTIQPESGTLNLGISGQSVQANGNFIPNGNGTRDLGNTNRRWKDLYLSNNLTDGTNSVTVEDLAALITYAKGQGWIS